MNRSTRINSTEIAKIAGVSRATVSRVLNKSANVKPETREKVLKIIDQFGYSPDISAQMLTGKRSNTIGFFVKTDIENEDIDFGVEDTHTQNMMFEIINIAAQKGFFVLIDVIHKFNDKTVDQRINDMFIQRRIDAGIFMNFPNKYPLIEKLVSKKFVVGILDHFLPEKNETNRIIVNFDETPMEKSIDYLYSLGHRNIMGVHGNLIGYSAMDKYNNFIQAMKKHELEIRPEWQLFSNFTKEKSYYDMCDFLGSGTPLPTAICCGNDVTALGVLAALNKFEIKIPDDVSVTGADDSAFSKRLSPKLTTSRVDFRLMLDTLVEKVIEYLNEPFNQQYMRKFGSEFIIRDSCKKIDL